MRLKNIIIALLSILCLAAPAMAANAPASFRGGPQAFPITTIVPVITCEFQGFALSGATWNAGTLTLTKTGAFAGYTYAAGDSILIDGGTGITKGRYKIDSKTSNDAIVLATSIGSNTADVSSRKGFESPYPLVVSCHLSTFDGAVAKMDVYQASWNFGDGSSTETLTNWKDSPTSTPALLTNSQAWTAASSGVSQPKAVHVYSTPGTYTVSCDIVTYNGTAYVTGQSTMQVVVSDWISVAGDTMFFDPANLGGAASNANDGLSAGAPKLNDEAAFRAHAIANHRIFFMSTGTITLTDGYTLQSNPRQRVLPYEGNEVLTLKASGVAWSGAAEILKARISTVDGSSVWMDVTYKNVIFDGNSQATRCVFSFIANGDTTTPAQCRGLRFLNCTFQNATTDRVQIDGPGLAWTVLYKCFIDGNDLAGLDLYGSDNLYTAVVGCRFNTNVGNPGNTGLTHFIYPSDWSDGLIAYCYGTGGYGRNFFINGNSEVLQQRLVITNNRLSGAGLLRGVDISNGALPAANEPRGSVDVVVSGKTGAVAAGDAVTQKNSGATGWVRTAPAGAGTLQVWTHNTALWTKNAADLVEKTAGVNYYTPDGSTNVVQTAPRLMDDVLIQGNTISGLLRGFSPTTGLYVTIRDNKIWNVAAHIEVDSQYTGQLQLRQYRNRRHVANGELVFDTSNVNLGVMLWLTQYNASFLLMQETIVDRNTNNSTNYLLRHQTGANAYSTIDQNQYWFTALTTGQFRNEATTSQATFSQWQAIGPGFYDANSTVTNPNWIDGPNGNFTTSAGGSRSSRISIGIGSGL
jgi:hypothetical protein